MGSHEKLLKRFLSFPKDFTWNELNRLLRKYGYYNILKYNDFIASIKYSEEDESFVGRIEGCSRVTQLLKSCKK